MTTVVHVLAVLGGCTVVVGAALAVLVVWLNRRIRDATPAETATADSPAVESRWVWLGTPTRQRVVHRDCVTARNNGYFDAICPDCQPKLIDQKARP